MSTETQTMINHAVAIANTTAKVIMVTQVMIDDLDAELAMIESSRRWCDGQLDANNLQALSWFFADHA